MFDPRDVFVDRRDVRAVLVDCDLNELFRRYRCEVNAWRLASAEARDGYEAARMIAVLAEAIAEYAVTGKAIESG